ncbi:MAG: 3-dehydroquinate synthase [Planctomycetes bacterium]|nr:3-dehydroquinate synthase [Planctomycetota bacterium]
MSTRVNVALGTRSYHVAIGCRLLPALHDFVAGRGPSSAVLVSDSHVAPLHAAAVEHSLAGTCPVHRLTVPAGERSKSLSQLGELYDTVLGKGLADRSSIVLALGGGVVGDLAGFLAATLLRGLSYIQLPTSLLAMVDSSVGGKTAINHAAGKNLIGAFHQPAAVFCDTAFLGTLPKREYVSGLAEVVKTAVIGDAALLAWLEGNVDAVLSGDAAALEHLLQACVRFKAGVVERDEHETGGLRAMLNFGHTFGHVLEAAWPGRLLHGEAVAMGMVAALGLSVRHAGLAPECARRVVALLGRFGLPTALPGSPVLDEATVLAYLRGDKKRAADSVSFVLLGAPGETRLQALKLETALARELLEAARGRA